MGRDILIPNGISAEQAIITYIREGRTDSARQWAKRPLIALTPDDMLGRVIWDPALYQVHDEATE